MCDADPSSHFGVIRHPEQPLMAVLTFLLAADRFKVASQSEAFNASWRRYYLVPDSHLVLIQGSNWHRRIAKNEIVLKEDTT